MMETLDESEIKKKLLEELQSAMAGRRVSPVLEIEINAPGGDDDDTTQTPGAEDDISPGGDLNDDMGGELDEPDDVKGRLGKLLKSRGMLG